MKIDAGEYPPMILGQIRWFVANKMEPAGFRRPSTPCSGRTSP